MAANYIPKDMAAKADALKKRADHFEPGPIWPELVTGKRVTSLAAGAEGAASVAAGAEGAEGAACAAALPNATTEMVAVQRRARQQAPQRHPVYTIKQSTEHWRHSLARAGGCPTAGRAAACAAAPAAFLMRVLLLLMLLMPAASAAAPTATAAAMAQAMAMAVVAAAAAEHH